jgi:hypothetical protein
MVGERLNRKSSARREYLILPRNQGQSGVVKCGSNLSISRISVSLAPDRCRVSDFHFAKDMFAEPGIVASDEAIWGE